MLQAVVSAARICEIIKLLKMMLGSKDVLTPLIPDCSALYAPAIFENIRNSLIFL